MKIILIGTDNTSPNPGEYYGQYLDFFNRSLKNAGDDRSTVDVTLIDDLFISVGDGNFTILDLKSNMHLKDFDLIMIRAKGLRHHADITRVISSYARHYGIAVINDNSGFRDASKLNQAVQLFENNIAIASCVFAGRGVLKGVHSLPFGFPCVMKSTYGTHGDDNYLVHSIKEAYGIALDNPDKKFILQRFVPNGGDYRILIAGDETMVIRRKAVGNSHLNNTSQGGSAELVAVADLPTQVIADARKLAASLSMAIAGVDALMDSETGEFYFLEINSQPQLMTGAFVDEKVALMSRYLTSLRT